jgi:hypothetical protein
VTRGEQYLFGNGEAVGTLDGEEDVGTVLGDREGCRDGEVEGRNVVDKES